MAMRQALVLQRQLGAQACAGPASRCRPPDALGDAMPKQPMDRGIAVGLAADQVITGRAVPLACEPLAGSRCPRWQLPMRALCTPCVERQAPGYRRGDKQGEHPEGECEIGTGERSARHKPDD